MSVTITAPKKALIQLLQRCASAAAKKSTMPILEYTKLTVDGDTVTALAGDMALWVETSLAADIIGSGTFAVSAKDTLDRVRGMPDGNVTLVQDPTKLTLTIKQSGSKRRYSLHTIPGDDYPVQPTLGEDRATLTLPPAAIAQLIGSTHFSVSTDESRPHLNSALFERVTDGPGLVRMVSTDGHRLSVQSVECDLEGDKQVGALIPLKAIGAIGKLCEEALSDPDASNVLLEIGKAWMSIRVADTIIISRTVDAAFPPYEQVIPNGGKETVCVRAELADAVRSMSVAASRSTNGVRFQFSGDSIVVSAEGPESGSASDELACEGKLKGLTLGMAARYVLDVLGAMACDRVKLTATDELGPVRIEPIDDINQVFVVMPMRI